MGQLTLPSNLAKPSQPSIPPPPPPRKTETESVTEKEESRFSLNEKVKLFLIIIAAITLPVFGTLVFSRMSYQKELEKYKVSSELKIEELRNQINLLTNPSVKKLEEYEILLKNKLTLYSTEKENLVKDPVYQEVIKKTKELDTHIIICNVHLKNIEIVKQNKYKEVDSLIETLNKEIIK